MRVLNVVNMQLKDITETNKWTHILSGLIA